MKTYCIFLLACIIAFSSCKESSSTFQTVLNTSKLPTQKFTISNNRDTSLLTKDGCIIYISKGSFTSKSDSINLLFKEAISMADIVKAGLLTQSGGDMLSTQGMFYLNTEDATSKIVKPLEILVPTEDYDADMKLFKGKEEDGKIDWVEPEALTTDPIMQSITAGEQLFKANCANCHMMENKYTGPALKGVTRKRETNWIKNWIKNPEAMNDPLSIKKKQEYAPVIMTSFPQLSDEALNNILTYLHTYSSKTKAQVASNTSSIVSDSACVYSCNAYRNALSEFQDLEENNYYTANDESFFDLDITSPLPSNTPSLQELEADLQTNKQKEVVVTEVESSTYYTVNIEAVGWYNIDKLVEDLGINEWSELNVSISNDNLPKLNLALIIPSENIFTDGGKLDNGKYGFKYTDGKILLPRNTKAIVIAFTEKDNEVYFGKTYFTTAVKNDLIVSLEKFKPEALDAAIAALKLPGIKSSTEISEFTKKARTVFER